MRTTTRKIIVVIWLLSAFLLSNRVLAQEQPRASRPALAKENPTDSVPDLSDITPLAAQLSGRLEALENQMAALSPDVFKFEKKLAVIEKNLTLPADQLLQLKESKIQGIKKLVSIKEAIQRENRSFEEISSPLKKSVRQAGFLRKEWLAEKKRWGQWQASMSEEGTLDQLKPAFAKANEAIDAALKLILPRLESMLAMQEKAGNIQTRIYALGEEVNGLIMIQRRFALSDKYLPMLSPRYFSQFNRELWQEMISGPDAITWPDHRFFAQSWWVMFLQGFLSIFMLVKILRNRELLKDKTRWQVIAERPVAASLFAGCMATLGLYEVVGTTDVWRLMVIVVGTISLARLVEVVTESIEAARFVYGLAVVLIVTKLLELVNLPLPLFRLYLVLTAVAGVVFCLDWAGKSKRKKLYFYARLFRLFSLFLIFIIAAELSGKSGLSFYLLISLITTIGVVVSYLFFRRLIRGTLEWAFKASLQRQTEVPDNDADTIIRHVAVVVDIVLWGLLFIPTIFLIWKVFDTLGGAIRGFLAFGINLGSQRISIGLVITCAAILYTTFVASWIIQKMVVDKMLAKRHVETGVRHAIEKLIHYVMVFVGFLLALSALGLEITKLTIMLSALGVGIGFGLQGVVNNFVSGIILLFERPVRVGDMVEIGGRWAVIKRIGLRSTTVTTFEGADLIIPNADMVNNEVTNWTLSSRQARIQIPVGVAYGSNVGLVIETLASCGSENSYVAKTIDPQVLFQRFGDNSLQFELRVWVSDVEKRLIAKSEIHQEIDRKFREAKIEIAFPQLDLHLRSIDKSKNLRPLGGSG